MNLISFCLLAFVAGLFLLVAGLIARTRPDPVIAGLGRAGVIVGTVAIVTGALAFLIPIALLLAFEHG